MATITSNATGVWATDATWVGGTAPNMAVDDAIVAAGHAVTLGSAITIGAGRSITINATGLIYMNASGRLYLHGGLLTIAGTLDIAGAGALAEFYGSVIMAAGGKVYITGQGYVRFSRRELQPVVTGDHTVIDFGKVYGYSSGPVKIGA